MFLFAIKTLVHDRGKMLTALIGVVFSLVLVNVQGGLFLGLIKKASVLIDHCDADIWIAHRGQDNVEVTHEIPVDWINRIRGLTDVAQAEPYIFTYGMATFPNGEFEGVWVVGSDRTTMLGSAWDFVEGSRADLLRPNSICIEEYDSAKLGDPKVGDIMDINGRKARIAAKTKGILGFTTTPLVFTTLDSSRDYTQIRPGYCSYFLVTAAPGVDLDTLRDRIQQRLPDLDVLTATQFARISQSYWMRRTGIGISFGASTLLGLLVGLVMVAQSLYALALDHLSDFATLKAMGAEDRHVYRVLVIQAMAIAGIGSMIGLELVVLIRHLCATPLAPIVIPPELAIGGVVLVFVICLVACLLPFGRLRRVDPAIVLQG